MVVGMGGRLIGLICLVVSDNIFRVWFIWCGNSVDMVLYLIEDWELERVDMEGLVLCLEVVLFFIMLLYSDIF